MNDEKQHTAPDEEDDTDYDRFGTDMGYDGEDDEVFILYSTQNRDNLRE